MNFFNNLPSLLQSIANVDQQQKFPIKNNNSAQAFLKVKNVPKRSATVQSSFEPSFDYDISNKVRNNNKMIELKTKIQQSAKDIFRLGLQIQYIEESFDVVIDNISKTKGNQGKLFRNYQRSI
ncbi:Hypothetical_protein [Hexamita inflata]|uniref:Hypothetical_protein n=1 Tax=Hexamita inflata TaxID=28002 RepID=A0AA86Q332_9EUKA|nr:Hypothetical protein HINF_LOCUS37963 [Hexamita inflata]